MHERELNDLQESVMDAIHHRVEMKPKWYFRVGAALWLISVASLLLFLVIVLERLIFGALICGRESSFLSEFSLWGIPLAVMGFFYSRTMLRRYDFAWRFNAWVFSFALIGILLLAAVLLHYMGLGGRWYGM